MGREWWGKGYNGNEKGYGGLILRDSFSPTC